MHCAACGSWRNARRRSAGRRTTLRAGGTRSAKRRRRASSPGSLASRRSCANERKRSNGRSRPARRAAVRTDHPDPQRLRNRTIATDAELASRCAGRWPSCGAARWPRRPSRAAQRSMDCAISNGHWPPGAVTQGPMTASGLRRSWRRPRRCAGVSMRWRLVSGTSARNRGRPTNRCRSRSVDRRRQVMGPDAILRPSGRRRRTCCAGWSACLPLGERSARLNPGFWRIWPDGRPGVPPAVGRRSRRPSRTSPRGRVCATVSGGRSKRSRRTVRARCRQPRRRGVWMSAPARRRRMATARSSTVTTASSPTTRRGAGRGVR